MKWGPIEDLPQTVAALDVAELRTSDELWAEQRTELEQLDGMKRLRELDVDGVEGERRLTDSRDVMVELFQIN